MKPSIIKFALSCMSASVLLLACSKKEDPKPVVKTGTAELHFDNKVGEEDLVSNSKTYTNYKGDPYQVTKVNYYISSIKFNADNGATYSEPESYHLVEESDMASQKISLSNIPAGKYTSVTFTIGVDSTRNVSGAQTGALDPTKGMFWSWNTGYIMAKFEGVSAKSTADGNKLIYHVGGFSGENNPLKTVTLNLPEAMEINDNSFHIHISADIAKWFGPANVIDFSALTTIHMPGADAKKLSDNYADMFSVEEIEKL